MGGEQVIFSASLTEGLPLLFQGLKSICNCSTMIATLGAPRLSLGAPARLQVDAGSKRWKSTKQHVMKRPRKTNPSQIRATRKVVYPEETEEAKNSKPPTFTVTKTPAPMVKEE